MPPVISGTTNPPSIDIQGSNPATIHVGDTYTDLGAIVTDNQGHDLGYKTLLKIHYYFSGLSKGISVKF